MTIPIIFPPGKGLFSISGFPMMSGDADGGPIGLGILENICLAIGILTLSQFAAEILLFCYTSRSRPPYGFFP